MTVTLKHVFCVSIELSEIEVPQLCNDEHRVRRVFYE